MELAAHATGLYWDWWEGYRFDRAIRAWACGETSEVVRETIQLLLLGNAGQHGTGCLPKNTMVEVIPARGTPDLLDSIRVRHVNGGVSVIGLKSYQRQRESFQGETLSWIWLDEEPPIDIYTECLTRTNVGSGPIWVTVTPLLGMSDTVSRFMLDPSADRTVITMTIDDCAHYSADEKQKIIASYPAHEREARTRGVPSLGSGRIFPVTEESITSDQQHFPPHWPRLGAMDMGWDHPFAAVELVWDRDTDTVYVTKAYRLREADTDIARRRAQVLGASSLDVAARRQARDLGRRRHLPGQAV